VQVAANINFANLGSVKSSLDSVIFAPFLGLSKVVGCICAEAYGRVYPKFPRISFTRGQKSITSPMATTACSAIFTRLVPPNLAPVVTITTSYTVRQSHPAESRKLGYATDSTKSETSAADETVACEKTRMARLGRYVSAKRSPQIPVDIRARVRTPPEPLCLTYNEYPTPNSNGGNSINDVSGDHWTKSRAAALIGLIAALVLFLFHPQNIVTVILFAVALVGLLAAILLEFLGA
jgi:hypothetical protein